MSLTHATSSGRQPDAELTQRILDETSRVLSEGGYSRLRIEQVAAAVGCGKAAIYRRWSSRAELAVDALCSRIEIGERLHSGDVAKDLVAHAWQNVKNQTDSGGQGPALSVWALTVDPEVRDHFWSRFGKIRRAMGREIIADGVARGQLPADVDDDAILDLLAGFVFYRGSMRNQPVKLADIRSLVSSIVADPPRRTRGARG